MPTHMGSERVAGERASDAARHVGNGAASDEAGDVPKKALNVKLRGKTGKDRRILSPVRRHENDRKGQHREMKRSKRAHQPIGCRPRGEVCEVQANAQKDELAVGDNGDETLESKFFGGDYPW